MCVQKMYCQILTFLHVGHLQGPVGILCLCVCVCVCVLGGGGHRLNWPWLCVRTGLSARLETSKYYWQGSLAEGRVEAPGVECLRTALAVQ